MNHVTLKGNLARDPEIKEISYGEKTTKVANFTLAVTRYFKRANGDKDKDTTFIPCEAWDTGADTIGKYLKKGDPVLLEGAIKVESWKNAEGENRSRMKIRVSNFDKLYRAPPKDDDSYGSNSSNSSSDNSSDNSSDKSSNDSNEPF